MMAGLAQWLGDAGEKLTFDGLIRFDGDLSDPPGEENDVLCGLPQLLLNAGLFGAQVEVVLPRSGLQRGDCGLPSDAPTVQVKKAQTLTLGGSPVVGSNAKRAAIPSSLIIVAGIFNPHLSSFRNAASSLNLDSQAYRFAITLSS